MGGTRVAWRALRLLWSSSPTAVAGLVVAQVAQGLAPAVVVAASASLLDHAPLAVRSHTAQRATVAALAILATGLVVAKVASAALTMLNYLVSHRFGAVVDELRIEAVHALPGLAHFDDPELVSCPVEN